MVFDWGSKAGTFSVSRLRTIRILWMVVMDRSPGGEGVLRPPAPLSVARRRSCVVSISFFDPHRERSAAAGDEVEGASDPLEALADGDRDACGREEALADEEQGASVEVEAVTGEEPGASSEVEALADDEQGACSKVEAPVGEREDARGERE